MTKAPTQIGGVRVTAAGRELYAKGAAIELGPLRPSAAIKSKYQARLEREIEDMHRSAMWFVRGAYDRAEPEMALDASPARELRAILRKWGRRWQARFDELSPKLAEYFATAAGERVDGELKRMLRKAGFTVRFKASRAQNDVLQATIAENVSLIKSIAENHLTQVEGIVMRSVQEGRDLATLSKALEGQYGVAKRRAAGIARSQNNMATASLTRVRQRELGIKQAKWLHSAGGKHPRPEHVAFSGKLYEVDKGAYLEGKWTWPGREINCRCVSIPVIPGFDA